MSRFPVLATIAAALLLTGCPQPPQVSGTVTDIFGLPLVGATVSVGGLPDQFTTGSDGTYSFPAQDTTMRLRASKDTYIADVDTLEPLAAGVKKGEAPVLQLIPQPDRNGFFLVQDKYYPLPQEPIQVVGTELKSVAGVRDPGPISASAKDSQMFVFKSGLRRSEIAQINLQLHELSFIEQTEAKGVFGDESVKLNLWVAGGRKGFELEGTTADDIYVLKTDKLAPGVYGFHTQGMLTQDEVAALDKLPKEQRVAYVFEVK